MNDCFVRIFSYSDFQLRDNCLYTFILYSAPYGKFLRKGWGPSVRSKWAWMIMELPSPVLMAYFFFTSDQKNLALVIFILFWLVHYLHRTFIYPFTQSGRDKSYPFILVCMAFMFNCLNGFVNGYGVFHLLIYSSSWLLSWQFITGTIIFVFGFIINKIADEKIKSISKGSQFTYLVQKEISGIS